MLNVKAVNLLEQVIKNMDKNILLSSKKYDEEEFSYEFKSEIKVSENDFEKIDWEEINYGEWRTKDGWSRKCTKRKHKKKRINKKWAKKYGYRLAFIEGKTKDATYNTQTGEFDFYYDDETIWQLYKHAANIFVYRVLREIGYTDWK